MTKKELTILAVFMLAVVTVVWRFFFAGAVSDRALVSTGDGTPSIETDEGESRLDHEVAAINRRLNAVVSNQRRMAGSQRHNATNIEEIEEQLDHLEQGGEAVAPQAPPPTEDSAIDTAIAQGQLLDLAISEDGRDPGWSDQAELRLQDQLQDSDIAALADHRVNCSSKMCKMTLGFTDGPSLDNVVQQRLQQITSLAPWNSSGFFRVDDQHQLHVYFSREGYELPRVESPDAS